ncbi:MAG: flagellar hook protein FlgE [Actinomycetota bacterium]
MMRSMFSGVSGLRSHQTMMDVVGNNISNVNTPGFKASQVTFTETLSQILRGPAGATDERGGINPIQIGLGVKVAGVEGIFTQGASQVTGRTTDLAIQGSGFFIVNSGDTEFFTRNGSFGFDEIGNLVTSQGLTVQGWTADAAGAIDPAAPVDDIRLPIGQVIDPIVTSQVDLGGNLDADAVVGATTTTSINVFDSIGNAHEVVFTLQKTAANTWSAAAGIDGTTYTLTPATLTFNTDGTLAAPTTMAFSGFTPPGAAAMAFNVVLNGPSSTVQFGGSTTLEAVSQDGQAIGFLRDFAIADDGSIFGQFSNGESKVLGRIATASFNNPAGLQRQGDSNFIQTTNSGEPLVGAPGSGNRGLLSAGTLEMSNVDLAREFTNLIIAQRGFQANSRVITTSDEMLSELVNLKR